MLYHGFLAPYFICFNMYWSKYNILCETERYGWLLFNTMSQIFIRIPDSAINDWKQLKDHPDLCDTLANGDSLLKARIIVDNIEDDLNAYLADVQKNRYNSSDVALTILPTRGCNFGCIYCYEQDRPAIMMDERTEDNIVRFLKSNPNMKRLSVVWYGGEPLINFKSIVRLTKKLQDLGVEYSAKMVTNGYLLTDDKARMLRELGIRHLQITLDGSKKTHDSRRFLLGGKPTYDTIINNLENLLKVDESITVDIRSNIDRRNKDDYAVFHDEFRSRISNKRANLYPGFVSDLLSSECVSPEHNISEGGYKADFVLEMFDRYGIEIKSFLPKFRRHSCVGSKYFAFVIGPEGEMYKCWRMVGNKKQEVGNVNDGSFDMVKFSRFIAGVDYTRDPKCLDCRFISLCGGGCPLVRMRNKYEGTNINHCCPEKTKMEKLMELRYEMYIKAQDKKC